MGKRAPEPSYLQPIDCMQAPCVRHAAQMIEQAMYEGNGGVGLIIGPLFPKRVEHPHWRTAYAAELAENPRLLAMLNDQNNRGVDGVYDAAGLTVAQREAVELRGSGLAVMEIARSLGIRHNAVRERLSYGLRKLKDTLSDRVLNGGVSNVA